MSYKLCYVQFLLLLGVIVIGCAVLSGCGDAPAIVRSDSGKVLVPNSDNATFETQQDPSEQGVQKTRSEQAEEDYEVSELYVGWEKPQDVLVFTGRQYGYVEPCGCTGLDRQKGGLARRHSFVLGLRDRGWNVVAVDSGNQVRRFGRQPELKFNLTSELLTKMEYQAVGLGPEDLKLPAGELFAVAAVDDNQQSLFISSNVAILDREFTRRFQLVETKNHRIAVASVIQDDWLKSLFSDDLVIEEAKQSLKQVASEEAFQQATFRILLVHGTMDFTRELAREQKDYDLVVCAGAPGEPAYQLEEVKGAKSRILKVGEKSMFASVVGIFENEIGKVSLKYQRVPLDASYSDSSKVLAMFKQYQEELQRSGFQGLGIKPEAHPSGYQFVGSQACAECHQEEFDVWENSTHAQATQSLLAPHGRAEIPRQFDPECLSCHSTGWQPQKYVPFESGFMSLADTLLLQGNGCENCHGPGSEHVRLESDPNTSPDSLLQLRLFLQQDINKAEQSCLECHDLDNSPDFHHEGAFQEYWNKISH